MDEKNDILGSEEALQIIKEIESNPRLTQRDLALKVEISLGKINFLINALIDKGIIEAKNFKNSKNKIAYTYLLTSKGIKIKLELIRKFLLWKMEQYERLKLEIDHLKKDALLAGTDNREPAGKI